MTGSFSYIYFVRLCLLVLVALITISSFGTSVEIISSSKVRNGDEILIVLRAVNEDYSINTSVSGFYPLISIPSSLDMNEVAFQRGVASLTTTVTSQVDFTISVNGLSGEKEVDLVNDIPIHSVTNQINTNTIWTDDYIYQIENDLTILANARIFIEEGTRVFLGEKVNIEVLGSIEVLGTSGNPVIFQSLNSNYSWGGIQLLNPNDSSVMNYAGFFRGGGDEDFIFGHSESQPVIMVNSSKLTMNNGFIVDNVGKAVGGIDGVFSLSNCVFSRCDTGGEYHSCFVEINDSYYLNIPNNDGFPADDDNDASYFSGVLPGLNSFSEINDCVFINGKDDAIDHNGANLKISNCWIEGFDHEGIATSNSNTVLVNNTLIKNCEQGMEAGYGSPELIINHCVLVDNNVGIRFGDSYNWGSEGQIMALNSILFNNEDNIYNYDLLTQGPVEGAIDISYSITNDPDYSDCLVCLNETPLFDENYFLLENSPGVGLASDGGDLGLANTWIGIESTEKFGINDISISPNPCRDKVELIFNSDGFEEITATLYNELGNLVLEKNLQNCNKGRNVFEMNTDRIHPGSYYLVVTNNGKVYKTVKIIKI